MHCKCFVSGYEEECYLKKMSLKSPISKVHEIAQKLKIDVGFDIVKERGKDHNKVFVMQGKLGSILVTTEAKSKKEAKKSAAELILERINELPGIPKEDYSIILKTKSKKNKKKNKQNKIVVSLDGIFAVFCTYLKICNIFSAKIEVAKRFCSERTISSVELCIRS